MEKTITPCLWFDTQGEDAARFYTSVFPNSRIDDVAYYGSAGPREEGTMMAVSFQLDGRPFVALNGGPREEGTVMAVSFQLDGRPFVALNGGPQFTFDEAVSFQVTCSDQEEIDRYWAALTEGGEEGPCGWAKDRFGVSWQIFPKRLTDLLADPDREKSQRVMEAMLRMRKIQLDELERAAAATAA